jgi:hypothetical protein
MFTHIFQFEELVNQFIPSDMSWKGWVKMAFHQPLVPVLPVARELFSKTKWIASKGTEELEYHKPPSKSPHLKASKDIDIDEDDRHSNPSGEMSVTRNMQPAHAWKKTSHRRVDSSVALITPTSLTNEPEPLDGIEISRPSSRNRVLSVFTRKSTRKA